MQTKYLKRNVVIEPLVSGWHAWSHLISPLTASAALKNRYLPIMNSFLQHPELHQQVFTEKKFSTGPYINISQENLPAVQLLRDNLLSENKILLELIDDFTELNRAISLSDAGLSLERLYSLIPQSLKGCIELVYDINHKPNIRYFEKILYNKYYNTKHQAIYLSPPPFDQRSYILSTPRINDNTGGLLPIPFNDPLVGKLVNLKNNKDVIDDIIERFQAAGIKPQVLNNLFTDEVMPGNNEINYYGKDIRVKYFGHACILIQTSTISILIDPLINYESISHSTYTYIDLPEIIDYVLITHAHQDHCSLETLLQIRDRVKQIIIPSCNQGFLPDPSLKLVLEACGFENVREVNTFDSITVPEGSIIATPFLGEHGDLDIRSKVAYNVKLKNKSFLFATDSNNLDPVLYENLQHLLGNITHLFIGMECVGAPYSWSYNHLLINKPSRDADQSRRLNGSDAKKVIEMLKCIKPQTVVIYAMGLESHLHYILGLGFNPESIPLREAKEVMRYCTNNKIANYQPYLKQEWFW